MEIVYILLPLSVLLALMGLLAFWIALRGGQFEDLDTPPQRMLFDDEDGRPDRDDRAR